MEKRINHGFNRGLLGIPGVKAKVFFEYFNDRIVKCHMVVGDYEVVGVSKLDPRDTYDRNAGEKVAMDKAFGKYFKHILTANQKLMELIQSRLRMYGDLKEGCFKKLSKIQNKK